jgi:NodT family efflux transporter outer membrane factor (OMF) lipoprotein
VPESWQHDQSNLPVVDNWIAQFNQPLLDELMDEAFATNFNLRQQAYNLQIMRQRLGQADAALWPELNLKLTSGRSESAASVSAENSSSFGLTLGYEVDVWGKLSASQKQAQLSLRAAEADYQQSRQNMAASLVNGWFDLVTAKKLLELVQQRVNNAKQNLDIIEAGYQQGLNSALDVYLSRNELNTEISNLAKQTNSQVQSARNMEKLIGRYPSGQLINLASKFDLPLLTTEMPLGLPSELIRRKPSLVASWYQVLAQDAGLAFAHKQRFPSINLIASVSDSQNELTDLLSGSPLSWSLLGSLTAPLFQAGKLKANEEIERLQLKQQEQIYLESLYNAFAAAENAISTEQSLKQQYKATLSAQENATAAENLAFEQYKLGLVSYTTVLDAQARSFNAQSALIQIKQQLLVNRVDMHIALGGRFTSDGQQQGRRNLALTNQVELNLVELNQEKNELQDGTIHE